MTTATYLETFGSSGPANKEANSQAPTMEERLHLWRLAGYHPSPIQWEAHTNPARLKLIAGGERGGKSYSAAMELISRHHLGELYWLIGPDYNLTRPEFKYLVEFFQKIGAIEDLSMPNSQFQPCSMRLKGGIEIATITAKDAQKIAGRAPDGILGCEAAQLDFEVYLKMLGRLSEKNGWLWLSGTFEHDSYLSWYAEQFEKWSVDNDENGRAFSLPTWANTAVYPGGLDDPKIKELIAKSPSEEWFLERYAGIPCPPPTAVFKEFKISLHVDNKGDRAVYRPFKLDPQGAPIKNKKGKPIPWEVELAIDPGFNGAYAVIALQVDGPMVYVIDEVYKQYTKAEDIIEECKKRPWWANVSRGVIDIAGTQQHGLASHWEVWNTYANVWLESVRVDIVPGIHRLRSFLETPNGPRIMYNPACKSSIKEYTLYRYRGVEEGKVTNEKPIDSFNHACKALSYWLVARYGFVDGNKAPTKRRVNYGKKESSRYRVGRSSASAGLRRSIEKRAGSAVRRAGQANQGDARAPVHGTEGLRTP